MVRKNRICEEAVGRIVSPRGTFLYNLVQGLLGHLLCHFSHVCSKFLSSGVHTFSLKELTFSLGC